MGKRLALLVAMVAVCGLGATAAVLAADAPQPELKYRAFVPAVARGDVATPTSVPTSSPRPEPYAGPVQTIYLGSARLTNNPVVEQRDTVTQGSREVFQDPSAPAKVAWYPRFGHPGFGGHNSIFAAHINYVGYGDGPFAHLTSAVAGDALYVTMANGDQYAYTVHSVEIVGLAALDMDAIVFPQLAENTERITLISCGGTFVPNPSGYGGEYNSRVILVAERYVP